MLKCITPTYVSILVSHKQSVINIYTCSTACLFFFSCYLKVPNLESVSNPFHPSCLFQSHQLKSHLFPLETAVTLARVTTIAELYFVLTISIIVNILLHVLDVPIFLFESK